jgi:pimeloyl-ACP methyl ester carboxylesterase
MIAVNAHLGYYRNGSIFTRLKEDVIDPARASGYDHIWLIGNSLGGYGSLAYAKEYSEDISGMLLLGPFLGDKGLIEEIRASGGLQSWSGQVVLGEPKEDWVKYLWVWLNDCTRQKACSSKIHLGYGRGDRFSGGQGFLASLLPPEQVVAVDGGHDWSTWKKLWRIFLDRDIFLSSPLPLRLP